MAGVWFEHPWALLGLLSLPMLVFSWRRAAARRQSSLATFARPLALYRLVSVSESRRRAAAALQLLALAALIFALAGPRWTRQQVSASRGHDLAIVLDLSRSMLAEQPSRQAKAFRVLNQLATDLDLSGRHRVALVVFASQPLLRFPLTSDAQHLSFALAQLDAARPPQEVRVMDATIASGTRIGAALQQALAGFPRPRPGRQHLLLVSDGDDPAGDDEWRVGVDAAHRAGVPIHVVALGDATRDYPIPVGAEPLRYLGQPVASRQQTQLLEAIARRTGGRFFSTETGHLQVLPVLERDWALLPPPPADDAPATLAAAHPVGLLIAALLAFCAAMGIGENARLRLPRPAAAAIALALVSIAATPTDPADDALRRGNDAFAQGKFDEALAWYDKAQSTTNDPGRVAFNRGAALFRLQRYSEAELAYRQAGEDSEAPTARRARAHYDQGVALLALADGKRTSTLEKAVQAFQQCLRIVDDPDLKGDAQHNLEVALHALRRQPPEPNQPNERLPRPPQAKPKQPGNTKNGSQTPAPHGVPSGIHDASGDPLAGRPGQRKLGAGPLTVLPDSDTRTPLSREEVRAHLERLQARLLATRSASTAPSPNFKDW
jgi:Ca-activated chloride channel family protein